MPTTIRSLLESARTDNAGPVPIPGVFNALVARSAQRAGFPAVYISGAATSVAAGVPDVGLLTLEHFTRTIRESADASQLPVLADADTGFGEGEMVRRTVIEYHRAGASALHLEDQVFPKRCGHLDGKSLLPADHAADKVRWAAKAARDIGDFLICARTDARSVEGLDAVVTRARAYLDAGASMIFPEGLTSEDEFATVATQLRESHPHCFLLANMTEFGKTPIIPLNTFADLGYSCVIYPVSMLRVAMKAVEDALTHLKDHGSVEGLLERMQNRQELYERIDYTPGTEWEWPA